MLGGLVFGSKGLLEPMNGASFVCFFPCNWFIKLAGTKHKLHIIDYSAQF